MQIIRRAKATNEIDTKNTRRKKTHTNKNGKSKHIKFTTNEERIGRKQYILKKHEKVRQMSYVYSLLEISGLEPIISVGEEMWVLHGIVFDIHAVVLSKFIFAFDDAILVQWCRGVAPFHQDCCWKA